MTDYVMPRLLLASLLLHAVLVLIAVRLTEHPVSVPPSFVVEQVELPAAAQAPKPAGQSAAGQPDASMAGGTPGRSKEESRGMPLNRQEKSVIPAPALPAPTRARPTPPRATPRPQPVAVKSMPAAVVPPVSGKPQAAAGIVPLGSQEGKPAAVAGGGAGWATAAAGNSGETRSALAGGGGARAEAGRGGRGSVSPAGAASAGDRERYVVLLKRLVEEHKQYPVASRRRGEEGSCQRRFVLERDGSVKRVETVTECGHPFLDQAASRAITAIGKFPPLPQEYVGGEAAFTVTLTFSLAKTY